MVYEPAEHTATERSLGRLSSGTDVSVTVHRYAGGDGPTVYVQAAQHGIELNGPAALRRLHDRLRSTELAGTVVVVPVVNSLAFDHRSYMTPAEYDVMNPNLNRVWPGDENGSLQERIAARLWELAADADAVVDLHTGTPDMLEHARYREGDDDARRLAEAFGTAYLLTDGDETPDDEDGPGTFRTATARAGIPAVTAELSNSRTVAHEAAQAGVDGVENVLRELDVLAATPADSPEQTTLRDDAAYTVADESGLFELRRGLTVGDELAEGTELGAIYCPSSFERLQTVTAAEGGVVYSLARESVVVSGERLAAVATRV
ncbi:succinylglutamate desuccinylase/aspartoacylase family protein [Halogeometricum limi]|uniref:Predicted deacylase n=1 Tax=Halogeometricum limi TaxID=555875 RepID=A0A1I6IGD6_9EURY|nr:succinylglutamate desuccinylase/aspartoacylase family protein [Halogeometricum limi]SFR65380.1 Predicted deacylase [Halogeometricum limi]